MAFRNREQAFLRRYSEAAREVILALLEKYRVGGIEELQPKVFNLSPFREMGGAYRIQHWFGGTEGLARALEELQERIYPEEEVVAV